MEKLNHPRVIRLFETVSRRPRESENPCACVMALCYHRSPHNQVGKDKKKEIKVSACFASLCLWLRRAFEISVRPSFLVYGEQLDRRMHEEVAIALLAQLIETCTYCCRTGSIHGSNEGGELQENSPRDGVRRRGQSVLVREAAETPGRRGGSTHPAAASRRGERRSRTQRGFWSQHLTRVHAPRIQALERSGARDPLLLDMHLLWQAARSLLTSRANPLEPGTVQLRLRKPPDKHPPAAAGRGRCPTYLRG